jgi:hypothetical protein
MTNHPSLTWALRPDPERGARLVALWSVEGDTGDMLEIDLMGQARRFRDQARSEWIVIEDDAPTLNMPVELAPLTGLTFGDAHEPIAG